MEFAKSKLIKVIDYRNSGYEKKMPKLNYKLNKNKLTIHGYRFAIFQDKKHGDYSVEF